jgi:hypothetical protein
MITRNVVLHARELQHTLGRAVKVVRLWPRDFWDLPD